MKNQRFMKILWLLAGVVGLAFLGFGFLTDIAAGRHAATIATQVSQMKAADQKFVPTAEQYHELCVSADALSHLFGNHVLAQIIFILPVTILAFITLGFIRRNKVRQEDAQPGTAGYSPPADGRLKPEC